MGEPETAWLSQKPPLYKSALPAPSGGANEEEGLPIGSRTEHRINRYVNAVGESLQVRTVVTSPEMLGDYMDSLSYANWEESERESDVIRFGEYISGYGTETLPL